MSFRAYLPSSDAFSRSACAQNAALAMEINTMQGEVFTVAEAAAYIGVSKDTMNKWRMASRSGEGPPWVRLGKRKVGYRKIDLDAWLQSKREGVAVAQ